MISHDESGAYLKMAPIGTRPHALAAFMYAIANSENAEIIYDHPIPSKDRVGPFRLIQFDFERLLELAQA
jgi:hypothetical protein